MVTIPKFLCFQLETQRCLRYSPRDLMLHLLQSQAQKFAQPRPELRPGYTVRVHQKVQEGGKERIQIFEGLILSVHKGRMSTDMTFTVRRLVQGIGVEKVFSVSSPTITKVEVVKVARVRRAKLFFLRGRRGKASRLNERFTNAGEFLSDEGFVEQEAVVEESADEDVSTDDNTEQEADSADIEASPASEDVTEEKKA